MESKGYVRHLGEGRAHRYYPCIQENAIRRSAVKQLVSTIFRGAPELLAAQLVNDRKMGPAELRRLRTLIDERLPERDR
jgi:predicted transcriptional regulator